MKKYVLDANAVLILLEGRDGAQRVKKFIQEAARTRSPIYLSAVNWGEVIYSLWRAEGEAAVRMFVREAVSPSLVVLAADRERATRAAQLKAVHDLGYADSFAAALAMELGATLVTADPEFQKLGKKLKVEFLPRHERRARK